jgi:Fe2+ transport system protein FeoA
MLYTRHSAFHIGQTFRVRSLGGDQRVAARLAQMGILPGMEFTIVRIGPLGNPLELAIAGGQSIALRNADVMALDCQLISLPLSVAQPGIQCYRISAIQGNPRYRKKLEELGLHPGTLVRIEAIRPYQLYLIEENRLIRLGQTEAQSLILQPVESNA